MAKFLPVLYLTLSGLLMAGASPQYGQQSDPAPPPSASLPSYAAPAPSYGGSAAAPAAPSSPSYGGAAPAAPSSPSYGGAAPAAPSSPSYGGAAPAAPSSPSYGGAAPAAPSSPYGASSSSGGSFGGSSSGSSSSGGSGGALTVQCKASPDGSGKIKYDCSGVNKDAITLKTEHFLWLENQGGSSQNLDIEIPNYKIDEFIRAAYKALGPQEGAKINILLKKPDVTYNAAKDDAPKQQVGQPAVSVNYQPVEKVSVHYPTQKQYTSGGPSAPPPGAGAPAPAGPGPQGHAFGPAAGAYSRPQRESGHAYYIIRQ